MAVLKDLIVHGKSRFLNGAQFNTINAESIGATQGIFNELIATTLNAQEATIENLTTTNAKVVGLLDVEGELHTNAWTNANIANIGGSFYISPTIEAVTGTISITRVVSNNTVSWTVAAAGNFATDFIKSGTSTSGVAWPANSLVLITGNITIGNIVYPLGTLKGTLNSQVTATAASTSKTVTITGVTDGQNNTTVLEQLYELNNNANISNAVFSDGKISLYKLGDYPIGISMSSMGTNSNSIIDIYGGVKDEPTVRIGHLAGLPAINGSAPTGWGIYTDNGYFSGVIVSNSGLIGNFTINNAIYDDLSSINGTSGGIYIGTDGIRNNSAETTNYVKISNGIIEAQGANIEGAINATSGTIGGLQITDGRLQIAANDVAFGSTNTVGDLQAFFTIDSLNKTAIFGNPDSFHITINTDKTSSDSGISFWNGAEGSSGNKIAYINGPMMVIPFSVSLDKIRIGSMDSNAWEWRISDTKHLTLKYVGGITS